MHHHRFCRNPRFVWVKGAKTLDSIITIEKVGGKPATAIKLMAVMSLGIQQVKEEVIHIKRQILVVDKDLAICQAIQNKLQDDITEVCCMSSETP